MKKVIRLTESDLVKLVKKVISEQSQPDWPKVKQYLESNGFPPNFTKENIIQNEEWGIVLQNNEHTIKFYDDEYHNVLVWKTASKEQGNVMYLKWKWDGTKPVLNKDFNIEPTRKAKGYATTEQQILDGTHVLGIGSRGDLVKKVQLYLKNKNSNPGNCGEDIQSCDGVYGPKTKRAVKDMQTKTKLKGVDGIVGKETWEYLF